MHDTRMIGPNRDLRIRLLFCISLLGSNDPIHGLAPISDGTCIRFSKQIILKTDHSQSM
jgi:hypothetical protein